MFTKRIPVIDRLMSRVEKTDFCWLWTGADCGAKGYGQMHISPGSGHSSRLVHRISYELHVGPIPEGLTIDHLCGNPKCINPGHLEAVSGEVNTRRRYERRTHCAKGHPLDGNTMSRGIARCRACHNQTNLAGYHRRKAQA